MQSIRCLTELDNRDCCHIDCKFFVRKGKIRCGKCVGKLDYRCAMCDKGLYEAKKVFCEDCVKIRQHVRWADTYDSEAYLQKHCTECNKVLTGHQMLRCSRKCTNRHNRSLRWKICPICFTPKEFGSALCEGDCRRNYNRLMMQVSRARRA